jgi:hypothetical protein
MERHDAGGSGVDESERLACGADPKDKAAGDLGKGQRLGARPGADEQLRRRLSEVQRLCGSACAQQRGAGSLL